MTNKNSRTISRFQAVNIGAKDHLAKPVATLCLATILSIAVFGTSVAIAGNSSDKRKDERLGGFTLEDESMLGRYGDFNDEWVPATRVQISRNQMSEETRRRTPKKDNRLGAFSSQDDAMLGPYGDKNDE